MTMAIGLGEKLEWDSAFFGVPVGQGQVETPVEVEAVDAWAEREGIRCVYLLVPAGRFAATQAAEARGFFQTGFRVTCACEAPFKVETAVGADGVVIRPVCPSDVHELKRIAATSHSDTRFYADGNFPRASCDRLYETWIERSCEGWADQVLVAERNGLHGYISLHLRANGQGTIGLFAVASHARRMGIGRALVHSALDWFAGRNVRRVSVATQAQNIAALHLYQRAGFMVCSVDLWLHKWR